LRLKPVERHTIIKLRRRQHRRRGEEKAPQKSSQKKQNITNANNGSKTEPAEGAEAEATTKKTIKG
jgi:hypothetical protein